MKKVLLAATIIAVMSSCSKSGNEKPDNQGTLARINLSSSLTVTAKSAIDGDEAIDGLQFLRSDVPDGATPNFIGATAIGGSRAVGGAITFQPAQDYTIAERTYFASYYPSGDRIADGVVEWDIDAKTDILTAAAIDAGTNASHASIAPLSYKHTLTQIEVVCTAEQSGTDVQARWGNIESIVLKNTTPVMSYSYATLSTTPQGAATDIALVSPDYTTDYTSTPISISNTTTVHAAGMFAAGAQTFTLEVTTANNGVKVLDIDLGAGNMLMQGMKHRIVLTFKGEPGPDPDPTPDTDEILIKATIEQWNPGTPGGGIVD